MAPSLSLPIPAEAHDMAVAGIVVLLALVAFISVLWLNRDGTQGGKNRGGVNAAQGTVFVTEDGKTVRRSARARKPAAEDALLATPAPKAEPKSPKATRAAPPKTPPKTPTAAKTPVAAAERMTSPGRTRRAAAAAPKATPIAATPDTAVRDATSPTRRRRRAI